MASNASDTASRSFGQNEVQDETDKSTAADDQLLLKVTQLAEEKGFLEQQVEMLTRQLEQVKLLCVAVRD
jgi:purine-nucleoside phosphorylase